MNYIKLYKKEYGRVLRILLVKDERFLLPEQKGADWKRLGTPDLIKLPRSVRKDIEARVDQCGFCLLEPSFEGVL